MIALILALQIVTLLGLVGGGIALYLHLTADDRHYSNRLRKGPKP